MGGCGGRENLAALDRLKGVYMKVNYLELFSDFFIAFGKFKAKDGVLDFIQFNLKKIESG